MKSIKVQIIGGSGDGKTTIAAIVAKALEAAGIPVTVGGQETQEPLGMQLTMLDSNVYQARIDAAHRNDLVVSVETVQAPRRPASVPQAPYV